MSQLASLPRAIDYLVSIGIVFFGYFLNTYDQQEFTAEIVNFLFFFYLGLILWGADRYRSSIILFRLLVPFLVKISYPEWKHMPLVYSVVCFCVAAIFIIRYIFYI